MIQNKSQKQERKKRRILAWLFVVLAILVIIVVLAIVYGKNTNVGKGMSSKESLSLRFKKTKVELANKLEELYNSTKKPIIYSTPAINIPPLKTVIISPPKTNPVPRPKPIIISTPVPQPKPNPVPPLKPIIISTPVPQPKPNLVPLPKPIIISTPVSPPKPLPKTINHLNPFTRPHNDNNQKKEPDIDIVVIIKKQQQEEEQQQQKEATKIPIKTTPPSKSRLHVKYSKLTNKNSLVLNKDYLAYSLVIDQLNPTFVIPRNLRRSNGQSWEFENPSSSQISFDFTQSSSIKVEVPTQKLPWDTTKIYTISSSPIIKLKITRLGFKIE